MIQWLRITLQCRGHRFNPWSGKIPHAKGQLSLWAATPEPTCSSYWSLRSREPMLCRKRSHHNEKPMHCNWRAAPALRNWRKACASQQRPSKAKNKVIKKKKKKEFKGKHDHKGNFMLLVDISLEKPNIIYSDRRQISGCLGVLMGDWFEWGSGIFF